MEKLLFQCTWALVKPPAIGRAVTPAQGPAHSLPGTHQWPSANGDSRDTVPGWRWHFGCHGHAEPVWVQGYSVPGQLHWLVSTVLPASLRWHSVRLPPWANAGRFPHVTCCGAVRCEVWGRTNAALLPQVQTSLARLLRSPLAMRSCIGPAWGGRSAAPANEPMWSCSGVGAAAGWDRTGTGTGMGTGTGTEGWP